MTDHACFDPYAVMDIGAYGCPFCGEEFDGAGDCGCTREYSLTPEQEEELVAKGMLYLTTKLAEERLLG
jgi:hypothetical protein